MHLNPKLIDSIPEDLRDLRYEEQGEEAETDEREEKNCGALNQRQCL